MKRIFKMRTLTLEQKKEALLKQGCFVVGFMTDEGINHYYNKMVLEGRIIN